MAITLFQIASCFVLAILAETKPESGNNVQESKVIMNITCGVYVCTDSQNLEDLCWIHILKTRIQLGEPPPQHLPTHLRIYQKRV